MAKIKSIIANEILDSRGNPTVETTLTLTDGSSVVASVPSGASVGKYEMVEIRDNDSSRYGGKGVLTAVRNVNEKIAPALLGQDPVKQGLIDETMIKMDGTENKSNLGANAILSVSIAVCKAAAVAVKLPLYAYINELISGKLPATVGHMPTPTFNVINGGKHGAGNLEFQEFHIVPASITPYHRCLQMGEEVYQKLKEVLAQRNAIHSVGDEGGFAPNLFNNADALEIIMEAIRGTKYKFGFEIFLGLDVAASNLRKEDRYFVRDKPTSLTTEEFIDYLSDIHHSYRLLLLEDPLSEDDWEGWQKLTQKIGREVLIIGDDLLATNPVRVRKAAAEKACSGILIKPNQIGTVSETLSVVKFSQANAMKVIVSHRSGETNDTFVADLAVGVNAQYVKFGAPARGERIAKYNRLLEIERELKL